MGIGDIAPILPPLYLYEFHLETFPSISAAVAAGVGAQLAADGPDHCLPGRVRINTFTRLSPINGQAVEKNK